MSFCTVVLLVSQCVRVDAAPLWDRTAAALVPPVVNRTDVQVCQRPDTVDKTSPWPGAFPGAGVEASGGGAPGRAAGWVPCPPARLDCPDAPDGIDEGSRRPAPWRARSSGPPSRATSRRSS